MMLYFFDTKIQLFPLFPLRPVIAELPLPYRYPLTHTFPSGISLGITLAAKAKKIRLPKRYFSLRGIKWRILRG